MTWTPLKIVFSAFVVLTILDSIAAVWGERRPVGGFFEEFLARLVFWGGNFVVLVGAGWVGVKVYQRTENRVIGWSAGILLCVGLLFAVVNLAQMLPGVDWRYERLLNSRDY